jgi:hypothetical protein
MLAICNLYLFRAIKSDIGFALVKATNGGASLGKLARIAWLVVLLTISLSGVSCSRSYYRESADRETYPIIAERIVSSAYGIGRVGVEPAAHSRLADPTSADHPPKPPDDPSAALFMANPGHMRGSKRWLEDGQIDFIEPPGWETHLGLEPSGVLRLTQDKAYDIALAQ